jgi:hypothetical protein
MRPGELPDVLERRLRRARVWAATASSERISSMSAQARWALTAGGFFLLLVARRPETVLRPEFTFEDGIEWYLGAWQLSPSDAIVTPYAGYLHFVPRVVGFLERLGPVSLAPWVGNTIALLIVALIATYISSDRLSSLVPSRFVRLIIALYLVVLPTTGMTLGSITFVQFYLALFLVAVALSNGSTTRFQEATTDVLVAMAVATGPFGLLLVPLFVGRLAVRRDGDSALLLAVVALVAAVQAGTLLSIGRPYAAPPTTSPSAILLVIMGHGATVLFGGRLIAKAIESGLPLWWVPTLGAAALGLAATHLRRLPWQWLLMAGYVATVIIVPALAAGSDDTALLLDPRSAARYFLVPGALLGASLIFAIAKRPRSAPAVAMAAILAVGIIGDFRLKPNPDLDWLQASRCIGLETACVVPVYPGGPWDIHWPGSTSGLGYDRTP